MTNPQRTKGRGLTYIVGGTWGSGERRADERGDEQITDRCVGGAEQGTRRTRKGGPRPQTQTETQTEDHWEHKEGETQGNTGEQARVQPQP